MPRKKGAPKSGGRVKNTPNKRTSESLKRAEYVLGLLDSTIDRDIKQLEPRERVKIWIDLQEYVRPKLARTEMKLEGEIKQTITHKTQFSIKPKGK